jgi:hypothetical protein
MLVNHPCNLPTFMSRYFKSLINEALKFFRRSALNHVPALGKQHNLTLSLPIASTAQTLQDFNQPPSAEAVGATSPAASVQNRHSLQETTFMLKTTVMALDLDRFTTGADPNFHDASRADEEAPAPRLRATTPPVATHASEARRSLPKRSPHSDNRRASM